MLAAEWEKPMAMEANWLMQLREVLSDYYPAGNDKNIVGYLKGSGEPGDWLAMAKQNQPQMLILGSVPPTSKEWGAAGKPGAAIIQTVLVEKMRGFIILYGGFIYRPWGRIELLDAEAMKNYQRGTIDAFRRNKASK